MHAARQPDLVTRLVRRFEAYGIPPDQAPGLAAVQLGFPPNDHHWTAEELRALVFLRELHRRGRFAP